MNYRLGENRDAFFRESYTIRKNSSGGIPMTNVTENCTKDKFITESAICEYGEMLKENERADATVEKYTFALRKLMCYLDGQPVSKTGLMEFRSCLNETHAAQTVNVAVSAINSYLEWQEMPEMKLKLLKVQRSSFCPQEKELTKAEYDRLVATARRLGKERLALLLETIGGTGIRVGEVKYITVEAARQGKAEIRMKGKIRTVLMEKKLSRKLMQYAKENGIESGEIFVTRNGRPLSRKQIWEEMKGLCKKAGVESSKVFPHNLRHLFARCYYKVTHDIVELADMLGHSSIETTRIYLRTCIEDHARTLAKLGLVT